MEIMSLKHDYKTYKCWKLEALTSLMSLCRPRSVRVAVGGRDLTDGTVIDRAPPPYVGTCTCVADVSADPREASRRWRVAYHSQVRERPHVYDDH